jgi:hypothetical protein
LHTTVYTRFFLAACLFCAPGCADDTHGDVANGAYETALPAVARRLAVIDSDYKSSALSLLDLDTQARVGAAILHSGSQVSATSTALSGDVVLGKTALSDGRIAVIDRTAAVVTLFAPESRLVTQLPVSTGFHANPQDYAPITANKAYVTRMGRNVAPTATPDDFDEGDDVLILDPTNGALLGRIAMTPYATLPGVNAMPARMVVAHGNVWVTIQSYSIDFKQEGHARLVAIDPLTDKVVQVVDVPGLKDCAPSNVLAEDDRFALVCSGLYADHATQATNSGVAVVLPGDLTTTVTNLMRAKDLPTGLPLGGDIACLPGGHCLITVPTEPASGTPDALWRIEWDGSAPQLVDHGSGPFSLSGMYADASTQRIYVGDRGFIGGDVRVFTLSATATVAGQPIVSNPGGLGATDLARF